MKGLTSPHLLLASSNPLKMVQNLNHLLKPNQLKKITDELDRNVVALYRLGEEHFNFATNISTTEWRQRISRFYYGAYNLRRAVMLKHSGLYSTDSSDHKNIDQLPDGLNNRQAHIVKLKDLREDRNLADYSHLAREADLVLSQSDALAFVSLFKNDCQQFLLVTHGLQV